MIFGVGFYSFTIGNLSSIIAEVDAGTTNLKNKLNTLTDFAMRIKLDNDVEMKIKKFIENNSKDNNTLE